MDALNGAEQGRLFSGGVAWLRQDPCGRERTHEGAKWRSLELHCAFRSTIVSGRLVLHDNSTDRDGLETQPRPCSLNDAAPPGYLTSADTGKAAGTNKC
jgi:hypothetical protein